MTITEKWLCVAVVFTLLGDFAMDYQVVKLERKVAHLEAAALTNSPSVWQGTNGHLWNIGHED